MRILVIGSGAREHALIWKLAQSRLVGKVFAAPGNAGIESLAESIPLTADRMVDLAHFASSARIDLTIVGPESPLVCGIVDCFQSKGLKIFGPTKAAARLEGSKAFAKEVMERTGVPTAPFRVFREVPEVVEYLRKADVPIVVKADGLAGGKGSIVAETREEAIRAATRILGERIFGEAGGQVVVEDCLVGEEVSIIGIVDGSHVQLLEPSQDHKRAFDQDQGANTGGMGAISPLPRVDGHLVQEIRRRIFEPVIQGMAIEGTPFVGALYAGLMLTADGPKVLEFNVRFGDPETQAILPRLKTDLMEVILGALEGSVDQIPVTWDSKASACVVLASEGYPGRYDIGRTITGLSRVADWPETLVFHAGTQREGQRLVTWGGRVLNVVGLGETLEAALERAYRAVDQIQFEGKQFRRDIGARALRYKALVSE
jgi:phosphoribosylamine--glycine ligase